MRKVYVFGWEFVIGTGAQGFGVEPEHLRGRELYATSEGRDKAVDEFGKHCEAIGFHCWRSYIYTPEETVNQ